MHAGCTAGATARTNFDLSTSRLAGGKHAEKKTLTSQQPGGSDNINVQSSHHQGSPAQQEQLLREDVQMIGESGQTPQGVQSQIESAIQDHSLLYEIRVAIFTPDPAGIFTMQEPKTYRLNACGFPSWLTEQVGHLGCIGAWPLPNLPIDDFRWKKICSDGITLVTKEAILLPGCSTQLAETTADH